MFEERKAAQPIELSDVDTSKRTAVIAHAVYDNIDRAKDVSRRGMFTKSWAEYKAIPLLIDHNKKKTVGKVIDLYDDEKKAYTRAKLSESTAGNDALIMMDEGIITGSSFGFYAMKANRIEVKGQKVRELKEVLQTETTITQELTPINLAAGVVEVHKAAMEMLEQEFKALGAAEKAALLQIARNDQATLEALVGLSGALDINSDLYSSVSWMLSRRADMMGDIRSTLRYSAMQAGELKAHLATMEKFVANTKASDDCINSVSTHIEETKAILSQYDTATTQLIPEPGASRNDNSRFATLLLINSSF